MESEENSVAWSIAIIGMSCRFPQAKTPRKFWENLRDGVDCVTEFSKEDLLAIGLNPMILNHPAYVNKGIVLEDVELFDASFFGFSPRDAEVIDPQHRIFMECAWEALEDAGYIPDSYEGLIGIYGGVDTSNYLLNIYMNPAVMQSVGLYTATLHNDKDCLTTRVAYKLNLKGPAVTVQTNGSTSMTAIIQACQSLLNYQCDIALAGGAAVTLPQRTGYFHQEGGSSSPDGRCRAFDAEAGGIVSGSGAGVLALKRLEEAIADGDHIEAVIRGFGINNDGSDKVDFTSPSLKGQADAIAAAHAMAGVSAEQIGYVEAHGTSTVIGDPVEVAALSQVFRQSSSKTGFCGLGSVKTNIGQCNSAGGVAGVIKAVMSLKNGMLAPSLHFHHPNPSIDFANSPFYVVNELQEWAVDHRPRLAGVSSFGIGGTNGHLVLEEVPATEKTLTPGQWHLLVLSAKTPSALETQKEQLVSILEQNQLPLADVAYTLQTGRKRFEYRAMLAVNEDEPLNTTGWINGKGEQRSVVFMFPGQGSQYVNMGRYAYENESTFRQIFDDCADRLLPLIGKDLRKVIYSQDADAAEQLKQTWLAQPALFTIEYALAKLWISWGVKPDALIGHSIGELVAACLAGVFSLEDGLRLVASRGKLMQSMPAGAMVAVHEPASDIIPLLSDVLSLAAINTPHSCVVSGPFEAIELFEKSLLERGISGQRLKTSHAFHSVMLEPIVKSFTDVVSEIALNAPQIPYLSNLTGTWIRSEEATSPAYWANQMRNAVQYSAGVQELMKNPSRTFLEVGPGNNLSSLLQQHSGAESSRILFSLPHPLSPQSESKLLTNTLGQLWLAGLEIDWAEVGHHVPRKKLSLPTYPFERQRYWIDPAINERDHNLSLRQDINQWLYTPFWKLETTRLNVSEKPEPKAAGSVLIFDNEEQSAKILSESLMQICGQAFIVRQGTGFSQVGTHDFTIAPENAADYVQLFEKLGSAGVEPACIFHLWNYGINFSEENDITNSFTSLLYLAQAFTNQQLNYHVQLKIVSDRLYQLHALEPVEPRKALSIGACKVISQEYPNIRCQNIDMEEGLLNGSLVGPLQAEMLNSSRDQHVLYRGGKRWVLAYRSADLLEVVSRSVLRKGGVYLITGGLGGIGLALSRYIGKKYKAKLILTGRSDFPAEENWSDWLASHSPDDRTSIKIGRLRQLRHAGAEVMVVGADVNNAEEMKRLSFQIKERFGIVNGIIHSAGIAGGGIIAIKKESDARRVIDPKMQGTINLHAAFQSANLDFMVLCSSLSAIVGGVGQVDYCAANNFQDAFAIAHNNRYGTRYVSVNWDTWSEAGMAVDTEVPVELRHGQQEALKTGIRHAEGMQVFERILAGRFPQVLVSTKELLGRIEQLTNQQTLVKQTTEFRETQQKSALHPRPKLENEYEPVSTPTEQALTEIWASLLGMEQIGIRDNFLELGGHSLLAIQLTSRMKSHFKIDFSIQSFFEAPTIKSVGELVDQILQNQSGKENRPTLTKLSRESYRIQNADKPKER
jgi:acyl transferase domain-containing protein/acyl carrier protein